VRRVAHIDLQHLYEFISLALIIISTFAMESVFVSAVAWVSKGFARRVPKQIEFTEEQMEELRNDPLVRKQYAG